MKMKLGLATLHPTTSRVDTRKCTVQGLRRQKSEEQCGFDEILQSLGMTEHVWFLLREISAGTKFGCSGAKDGIQSSPKKK
jgi:hypothetical protein